MCWRCEQKPWCPVCDAERGIKRDRNPYTWKLCAAHDRPERKPRKPPQPKPKATP